MSLKEAVALHLAGDRAGAAPLYVRYLDDNPDDRRARYNFGLLLLESGAVEDSVGHFRRVIAEDDAHGAAHYSLGKALVALGRAEDAILHFERAVHLAPGDINAHAELNSVLCVAGQGEAAETYARIALDAVGETAAAFFLLGLALFVQKRHGEAEPVFRRALDLDPGFGPALRNLAQTCNELKRPCDALSVARRYLAGAPFDAGMQANVIMWMHYCGAGAADILAEARAWGRGVAVAAGSVVPAATEADPDRPLRVGYMSNDLRRHPVGYFMAGVFAHHDRAAVEPVVYAGGEPDAMTARCRAAIGDSWVETGGWSDDRLAERIRDDRIDLLVDLAGHTAGNRLGVIARRPAPVRLCGGGNFTTTGLEATDYVIADRYQVPEGYERFYCETVLRLPGSYICYTPPPDAPGVAPPPMLANGFVTFGSFNNASKLNPDTVALWSRVLGAVPGSRLLLKSFELGGGAVARDVVQRFARHGVAPERVVLQGGSPHRDLLAAYGEMDIALDPLHYSGGLTTLEALLMGVPVVTASTGQTFCSLHSTSHLTVAGHPELVCGSTDAYVALAAALAGDPGRLSALRAALRADLTGSSLCDGETYTRRLEAAYRDIWRRWCANA